MRHHGDLYNEDDATGFVVTSPARMAGLEITHTRLGNDAELKASTLAYDWGREAAAAHLKGKKSLTPFEKETLEVLEDGEPLPEVMTPGRMYEVEIDTHPEQFLDWDKTLPNQSPAVIDALRKKIGAKAFTRSSDMTGGEFVQELLQSSHKDVLSGAGVPGIKYLDQGSRGIGAGTSNYVVFDDSIVKIMRKYGIPMTAAGAALAQQMLSAGDAQAAD